MAVEISMTDRLCLKCGLCCNGVLFADVVLQSGDKSEPLQRVGVPLLPKGNKLKFNQPCPCLEGLRCRIYGEHPLRCRKFDCRLLMKAKAGQMTILTALRIIHEAQKQAKVIRKLLRQLGQMDEHLPLSQRCQAIMKQPIDLSLGAVYSRRRGKLLVAVCELTALTRQEFLT